MKNKTGLTNEQSNQLSGYYDNLASFFGGDELIPIEKACDGMFNTNYFSIIRKLSKQLDRVLKATSYDEPVITYNNKITIPNNNLSRRTDRWSVVEKWKLEN